MRNYKSCQSWIQFKIKSCCKILQYLADSWTDKLIYLYFTIYFSTTLTEWMLPRSPLCACVNRAAGCRHQRGKYWVIISHNATENTNSCQENTYNIWTGYNLCYSRFWINTTHQNTLWFTSGECTKFWFLFCYFFYPRFRICMFSLTIAVSVSLWEHDCVHKS